MTADRAARAAPTTPARWNPETKERSAVRARATPAARGRLPATCSAPASDDRAVARAAGARARSPERPLAYREAARLPSTATPRAAPSSRVVSFIAEPAPARRGGTADMIEAVMGEIDSAMPPTIGTRHATT